MKGSNVGESHLPYPHGEKKQFLWIPRQVKFLKQKKLSIPHICRPPTDGGTWGSDRDGDGVYSGLLGDLQARRADLGVAQLFVRRKRMGIMDFSGHYDYDYSCFMVRKPKPLPQVKKNGEDFCCFFC